MIKVNSVEDTSNAHGWWTHWYHGRHKYMEYYTRVQGNRAFIKFRKQKESSDSPIPTAKEVAKIAGEISRDMWSNYLVKGELYGDYWECINKGRIVQ